MIRVQCTLFGEPCEVEYFYLHDTLYFSINGGPETRSSAFKTLGEARIAFLEECVEILFDTEEP